MIDPRTLRGQLALAYATALLVALIAFAAMTLLVVDRTQRVSLDDRLQTALRAVGALTDVRNGRVVLDARDFSQFAHVVGNRLDAAIVDRGGKAIATTVDAIPSGVIAAARGATGPPHVETVSTDEGNVRVALEPVRSGDATYGAVAVWREYDDIGQLDRRLMILFAFAIPVVAVFAVVAGSAVARRGLRPLDSLASLASEIEERDLSLRLALPPRDDELGRLCATFDRMLDRLEAAFARQRRFTGDASHELRAPLSVIRAEADLMLRRPRTPAEYERALRSIAAQADYLEAVTRDLLAAARAEASDRSATIVDLGGVAREAAARLERLAEARGVEVTVATAGDSSVRGDEQALVRAAVCVVHNALKYARRRVEIGVERTGAGDAIRLAVRDDGPGFGDEALMHATERFWRDDASAVQRGTDAETSGAGLGLPIVAAIVEAGGGTLELTNASGGGALVIVELPSAKPGA
ncbi:MAG: integral rane sensor signal transduction histidine kinase [Candidatus Eremiobacteraeota bacterium]|nr:integral rane sensor signal transduction histidine kinase [Candidatus Eremiobacteraeota bacterium]